MILTARVTGWLFKNIFFNDLILNSTACFLGGTSGKEPACQCRRHKRHRFDPWVRKIPWRRKWQPTPVFLAGKSHEHRSLAGNSLWGCKVGHHWAHIQKSQYINGKSRTAAWQPDHHKIPWAAPAAPQMNPRDSQKTTTARKPWIFIICISKLKLLIWANGTRNIHGERPVTASHAQASISQCQESLPRPQVMNRVNVDRLCLWDPGQAAALGSPTLRLGPVVCCSSHGSTHHQREKGHREGQQMVGNGKTIQLSTGVAVTGHFP